MSEKKSKSGKQVEQKFIPAEVTAVSYSFYSEKEVKETGPLELTYNAKKIDSVLYHPAQGPPHPREKKATPQCESCGEYHAKCTGHWAYIEFAEKIYNPTTMKQTAD